jgi:glycerophosphoryl diester phosphodiesterase
MLTMPAVRFPRTYVAILTFLAMLFLIRTSALPTCAAAEPTNEDLQSAPLVIAHRGASGYLPEHTLPAVALAHGLGADMIEQDVIVSKDGELIVIHDRILDHVTNVAKIFPSRKRADGHFHVADFTLPELRTLNVHERTDPKSGQLQHPARFPLGKGHFHLATLAEHAELIQGLNHSTGRDVTMLVELKDPTWHREQGHDMGQLTLDALAKQGFKSRTDSAIVQSFDMAEMRRLREKLHTDLRIVQLMNEDTLKLAPHATREQISAALGKVAQYADGIGPSVEMLLALTHKADGLTLAELIELAHEADLTVYCYTFRIESVPKEFSSFEELVETFTEAGVDGIITDFPDKVRSFLPATVN